MKIELTDVQILAINNTLQSAEYRDFMEAQEKYYDLLTKAGIDTNYTFKNPRSRHCFSAKAIKKLLRNADFFIISAGVDDANDIKFCIQRVVKSKKDTNTYTIDEQKTLTSYPGGGVPVHPINGIPNE